MHQSDISLSPILSRTLDGSDLSRIANHPEVRPWLGGEGVLDLSLLVANPDNVALLAEGGGFICIKRDAGLYEVHSMFLPEARSGRTVELMEAGFAYMFARTDCIELVTKVPDGNAPAANLAKYGGFQPKFRREACWAFEGNMVGVEHLSLTLEVWAFRSKECAAEGQFFHDQLEQAKTSFGSDLPTHDDDASHDGMVGATAMMLAAGNIDKGVSVYNRWAAFAGYALISIISQSPPIIDVADAIVEVGPDGMSVLLCR